MSTNESQLERPEPTNPDDHQKTALAQCDALLATLATLVGAATTNAAEADLMAAHANVLCARGLVQSAQEAK